MKQALIVIDIQQSFRTRPFWDETEFPAFIANVQALVDGARTRGARIAQVFHVSEAEGPQGAFSRSGGKVATLAPLRIAADEVFHKSVHSSLFGRAADGSTLEQWLQAHAIEEVLVCGMRTEQCCETTARHASDLGYQVRFVSDATLTFPMRHASGRMYPAQDIRERTELVLAGRFAAIVPTAAAYV